MIEETARVESVSTQGVQVVTTQSSACNKCNEAASCSTSVLSKFFGDKEIVLSLQSDLALEAGDEVLLGIEEKAFLGLTCLVYFVPICALLLCAVLGQYIGQELNISNEFPAILSAAIGFLSCYYCIKQLIKGFFSPERINPVILKKL